MLYRLLFVFVFDKLMELCMEVFLMLSFFKLLVDVDLFFVSFFLMFLVEVEVFFIIFVCGEVCVLLYFGFC